MVQYRKIPVVMTPSPYHYSSNGTREAKHELSKTAIPVAALQNLIVFTALLQKRIAVHGDLNSPRKFNTLVSGLHNSWETFI